MGTVYRDVCDDDNSNTLSKEETAMLTATQLAKVAGTRTPGRYAEEIAATTNRWAAFYGVRTSSDLSMFFANVTVETGGFKLMSENMNYSAARLRQVWPSRFPTTASTKGFANNPRALANKVYGSRLGNKGRPDAGWLYRGSGPGQVTGYDNFLTCEKLTGIPFTTDPDLMRDPVFGTRAALALWQKFGMSKYSKTADVTAARKRWNGGAHGLEQTRAAFVRAVKLGLSVPPAAPAPAPAPLMPEPSPAPEPAPFVATVPVVAAVQRVLWEKGYTETGSRRSDGTFDGDKGKLTDAAILAAKSENNFLPLDADISPEFLAALPGFPARKLAVARANATTSEVASKVPEARANWWGQLMSAITGFFSTVAAMLLGIFQYFGVAKETVDQLKEYAADIPGEFWLGAVAVVMVGLFLLNRHGLNSSVKAFQKAERR